MVLVSLAAATAAGEAPSQLEVPPTQNPYIPAVATLYDQAKPEEALSKLEKALDWKSNGPQEVLWLKLMQGVLRAELAPGEALESFKEALALDAGAQLPVKASRRVRKLFEQARSTAGMSAGEEILAEELEPEFVTPSATPTLVAVPPAWGQGLTVVFNGAVGTNEYYISTSTGLGYTWEALGGAMIGVLALDSLGLRAEGQLHPLTLGRVRPYAGVGATAYSNGRASMQGALGMQVRLTPRMYGFAGVTFEHTLTDEKNTRLSKLRLLSVGLGMFP
jgi:tetratricopeptide (TPR) repeat protein